MHAVAPMLDDELCAQQMAAVCEIWTGIVTYVKQLLGFRLELNNHGL